jgi:hypothetical protein
VDLFDDHVAAVVLSAVMVSRVLVVKNAWNRQVSNRVACPVWGFRSGIRRTTSRPVSVRKLHLRDALPAG